MKVFSIIIAMLCSNLLQAAPSEEMKSEFRKFKSETKSLQLDQAAKIKDLRIKFINDNFEMRKQMINEVGSLQSSSELGNKEKMKALKAQIKAKRKEFQAKMKAKRQEFSKSVLKNNRESFKKLMKTRRQEFRNRIKKLRDARKKQNSVAK